jgi:hypothetical protein
MHALPSLVEHGLTTRFQTASLLKEATSGSSGDLIGYIQPSRLQREENDFISGKKLEICGWLFKTEMASLHGN